MNNFLNDKWKKIILFAIIIVAIEFSGHGIFASCDINAKHDLGSTHIKVPMIVGYIRTPLGGFINHSEEPNSVLVHVGPKSYLIFNRPIQAGEEITLKYTMYNPSKEEE